MVVKGFEGHSPGAKASSGDTTMMFLTPIDVWNEVATHFQGADIDADNNTMSLLE